MIAPEPVKTIGAADPRHRSPVRRLACNTCSLASAVALFTYAVAAQAGDLVPAKVLTVTPTGINIATTTLTFSNTDLSIGALALERFYSGGPSEQRDPDTMFYGAHQSNNFDIYVTPVFTPVSGGGSPYARPQVHLGATSSGMFLQTQLTGTTAYFNTDSLDAGKGQLRLVNNAYEYTDSIGAVYLFNPAVQVAGAQGTGTYQPNTQRIASITYPDGRVRSFSYVNGQLKFVSDTTGYAIVFDYGTNGLISAACGFNASQTFVSTSTTCTGVALKVAYGYTPDPTYGTNYLSSFTDPLGQVTTYSAAPTNGSILITCIRPPGYSSCSITNAWGPNTVTQTLADGATWSSTSQNGVKGLETDDGCVLESDNSASFTDPNGKTTYFSFTGTSPYSMTNPNGDTMLYRFTGGRTAENEAALCADTSFGSLLQSVTLPEGNEYLVESNGPFQATSKETWKAKSGSGLADIVKNYGYDLSASTVAQAVHPISITDERGNVTYFTWATHGGQLSEMKPAPSAGAARPLKLTTWVQKYAYIKDASGALVPMTDPVWLIASETSCETAPGSNSPVCGAGVPQMVKTYQYGADGTADNLLLRSTTVTGAGKTLRTCYGYDTLGNRIWTTTPRGQC